MRIIANLLQVGMGGAKVQHVILMLSLCLMLFCSHAVHQASPLLHLQPMTRAECGRSSMLHAAATALHGCISHFSADHEGPGE